MLATEVLILEFFNFVTYRIQIFDSLDLILKYVKNPDEIGKNLRQVMIFDKPILLSSLVGWNVKLA